MNRKLIAAGIIGAALLGAAVVVSMITAPAPLMDTAPTSIITAPPRTARPTPGAPTPTGTIAPTPTVEGFWMFAAADIAGVGCANAALTPVATVPLAGIETETDGSAAEVTVALCNLNTFPITVSWRTRYEYIGFSYAGQGINQCQTLPGSCSPAFTNWNTANIYNEQPCTGSLFGAHREYDETRMVILYPYSTPAVNTYEFNLSAQGSGDVDCGTQFSEIEWEIEPIWDPNPGGGDATPTPSGTDAWITEVLARPQGTVCGNWNLRGSCGNDDQFVEVGVPSAMSLAGYRIDVVDGSDVVACTYTIAQDNWTDPLKAFWQDAMSRSSATATPTPTGTPPATPTGSPAACGLWPETGAALLYDADGELIDTREYDYSAGGQYGDSWAAMDWTNPDGPWWWYSPSPGRANRVPPTVTPTP